VVLKVDWS